jgi:hypothetical protein
MADLSPYRAFVASVFVGIFAGLRAHAAVAARLVDELVAGRRPPADELRHHLREAFNAYEEALRQEVSARTAITMCERNVDSGAVEVPDMLESSDARAAFRFALAGAPNESDALVLALVVFRKFVNLFGELVQTLLDETETGYGPLSEQAQTLAAAAELAAHHEGAWRAYFALVAPPDVSLPDPDSTGDVADLRPR